jgi:carboxypeptidase Q
MRTLLLAAACALALFPASASQAQTAYDSVILRRISDEVMRNGRAYENLRFLCKQVGHRLSGSPAAAKAVEETARMLREAGADRVWLQPCRVPQWVRGPKEQARVLAARGGEWSLSVVALGNSVGTPEQGVRAEVVEVRDFAELNRLGREGIAGRIVFYNHPMDPTEIATFRAYGRAGAYRSNGPSQAARYGAVGVIVRSLASNSDDYPHTGATRYNDSFPKLPAIAVSTRDAEKLSEAIARGQVRSVWFKTGCRMLPDVMSHNVIGEIVGSERPDEVITVGGHLDSWDIGEGAHDDGAGCVQSIEVIRALKALGIRPRRTIRAVMFMNEENGLRGGQAYADSASLEKVRHIFALESDAGGFSPRGFGFTAPPDKLAKILTWKQLFHPYGAENLVNGGGGADIGPLRPLGTVLAGLVPDPQRYFDVHHSAADVFEAVSPRELHLGAVVMAAMAWLVSEKGL